MYERKSQSGHKVEWNPEHEEEAKEAMQEVVGETNVAVKKETSKEIRERYRELIESDDE